MYTVERLLRVSSGQESPHSTLDRPLEHLVACHGRIEERLEVLERAGAVLGSQPREALQAIDSCFRYFESSGVAHTADEEQSVFPRILGRLDAAEVAEIEMLEKQHREADAIYAELKSLAARLGEKDAAGAADPGLAADFRSAVARFSQLYRGHIEFENRRLIEVARRLLAPDELAAISGEMRARRNF